MDSQNKREDVAEQKAVLTEEHQKSNSRISSVFEEEINALNQFVISGLWAPGYKPGERLMRESQEDFEDSEERLVRRGRGDNV